jgi:hypothetical protein
VISPRDNVFPTPEGTGRPGITFREYAAVAILAGFAADPTTGNDRPEKIAEAAVRWADALCVALNRN